MPAALNRPAPSTTTGALRRGAAVAAALAVLALATAVPAAPVAATPACGPFVVSGDTAEHQVSTPEQLAAVGSSFGTGKCDPTARYRIMNDIVVPARSTALISSNAFRGVLLGDGHTITLDIDNTDGTQAIGLFLTVGGFFDPEPARIEDLVLAGSVRTTSNVAAGALAGVLQGPLVLSEVTSTVTVRGLENVGGLLGTAWSGTSLHLSAVSVGTPDAPVLLEGSRQVGGIAGSIAALVVQGSADVHVALAVAPTTPAGTNVASFGGLVGNTIGSLTVDGFDGGMSAGGVTVGVTFEAPAETRVSQVGGIAGVIGVIAGSTVLVQGVDLTVDLRAATSIGGIAGEVSATGITIGGPADGAAVTIGGSIVATPVGSSGARAAGITAFAWSGTDTSIRNLTMAASVSGEEVGGLSMQVNGTLLVEDTVVSGDLEGSMSAGGIAVSLADADVTLRRVAVTGDLQADQVGGVATYGAGTSLILLIDDVTVSGTLRSNPGSHGLRGVGGMFMNLVGTDAFAAPPVFSAADATIVATFPEGLELGATAFLRVAGLVAFLGTAGTTTLVGTPAALDVTVSAAMRDAQRCLVASRTISGFVGWMLVLVDRLSPDPCPAPDATTDGAGGTDAGTPPDDGTDTTTDSGTDADTSTDVSAGTTTDVGTDGGTDAGADAGADAGTDATTGAGPSVSLDCTSPTLAVGAPVTCTVVHGSPGTEVSWNALVNPVVGSGTLVLDAEGAGTFTFAVPPTALGQPLAVELVGLGEPLVLGTVTGAVPSRVPAGEGRAGVGGDAGLVRSAMLALLGAVLLARRLTRQVALPRLQPQPQPQPIRR